MWVRSVYRWLSLLPGHGTAQFTVCGPDPEVLAIRRIVQERPQLVSIVGTVPVSDGMKSWRSYPSDVADVRV